MGSVSISSWGIILKLDWDKEERVASVEVNKEAVAWNMFLKKDALKNFGKFTEKHQGGVSFLIILEAEC